MTRASLSGRFSARFQPDNAVLLVAGDVSHEEVTATAEERLGRWSTDGPGPAPTHPEAGYARPGPTTIYLADKPGAVQSVIRAGHLTIPRHHEEYHAMNLLNHLFGGQFTSRLNMNLRQEKGYSYGYSSAIDWALGPSALLAGGGVQAEVTKEAVAETLKEFADIRGDRPVTEEEFAAARTSTLRAFPAQFETVGQALRQLTSSRRLRSTPGLLRLAALGNRVRYPGRRPPGGAGAAGQRSSGGPGGRRRRCRRARTGGAGSPHRARGLRGPPGAGPVEAVSPHPFDKPQGGL